MKSKITLFVLGLFCQIAFGQATAEKVLHGKLVVDKGFVGGVTIINLVNEKSTISDRNGDFFILAKPDDLLVFSSVNLEYYRRILDEADFKPAVLVLKMTSKITVLEEVVVNKYPEINAVSLGISPKGIKHRTQMERRLYTAGDFKPIDLLGLLGGSLDVDAVLNSINGRTAMTKKLIQLEKKIVVLEKTNLLFEDQFYTNTLKIPVEYIKGFKYYMADNSEFSNLLQSKNKAKIEFMMGQLATKYIDIIATESK